MIDEADRLLKQSFQNWLSQVRSHILPPAIPLELPVGVERLPHDSIATAWQKRPWSEDSMPISTPVCPLVHHPFVGLTLVQCQKFLFSATLTRDPGAIASLSLRHPQYIVVQSAILEPDATSFGENFALPTSLSERMLILPPALKPLNLVHLVHHPEHRVRSALIFTKSVESAERLTKLLEYFEDAWVEEKVVVRSYTREMKPAERKKLLADFAAGEVHL